MRIAPYELGDDTLDFNFLCGVVFRRKRVMREHLTATGENGEAGDQHHDRAFHGASPSIHYSAGSGQLVARTRTYCLLPAAYCLLTRLLYAASTNISVV